MKIKCIKSNGYSIRIGAIYEVIEKTETRYSIVNEKGLIRNYSKKLFVQVETKLTFTQILDSFCMVEDELQFKKVNGDDLVIEVQDFAKLQESEISCGIKELNNINDLVSIVNSTINKHYSFSDQENERLKVKALFLCVKIAAELDIRSYRFLLVSTNTDCKENESINDHYNIICKALSLKGESMQLIETNPNTENEISLWVLDVLEVFKD